MWRLLVKYDFKPGSKILDMGSGLGFPLLAFAYAGLRAYGTEENSGVLSASTWNIEHAAEVLGKKLEHEPILMGGRYNNGFALRKFSDGVSPLEMDGFFCFCYIDGEEPVAESLRYAKDGAILTLPQRLFSKDFLKKNKFKPIDSGDEESYLVKDRLIG